MESSPFFNSDLIFWGILPTLAALIIVTKSAMVLTKAKTTFNWIITISIMILNSLALAILYYIFNLDAWPTLMPHGFIGFSLILVIFQMVIKSGNNDGTQRFTN